MSVDDNKRKHKNLPSMQRVHLESCTIKESPHVIFVFQTTPVQNRLAVGHPPSALSPAAQQGGQTPGSGGIPVTGPPGAAPPHSQLPDGAPNTSGQYCAS